MGDLLGKLKFPVVLLLGGLILCLVSASTKVDLKNWTFDGRAHVSWPLLSIGLVLCLLALLTFLTQEGLLSAIDGARTRKTKTGFSASQSMAFSLRARGAPAQWTNRATTSR